MYGEGVVCGTESGDADWTDWRDDRVMEEILIIGRVVGVRGGFIIIVVVVVIIVIVIVVIVVVVVTVVAVVVFVFLLFLLVVVVVEGVVMGARVREVSVWEEA